MKATILLIIMILLSGAAYAAECIDPADGMTITQNTALCTRTYDLPSGIYIGADNIELDCEGAILRGNLRGETGININGRKNIIIRECNILTYKIGIYLKNTTHTTITKTSLLKNKIGLRLLDSYENNVTEVNDKSTDTPVSVINSKFNIFLIDNKNIYGGFCSSNVCNKLINMSFCHDNDFYCSESCNSENDRDCKGIRDPLAQQPEPAAEPQKQEEAKPSEPAQEAVQSTPAETNETPTAMAAQEITSDESKINTGLIIFYVITYLIAFFVLQFYTFAKKY